MTEIRTPIAAVKIKHANHYTMNHSIPTDVPKHIKSNICSPLKEIINLSFATGIYAIKLKGKPSV